MSSTKTFTLRLPADLYARCATHARKKDVSLNAYVQESLDVVLKFEEDRALYEAFGRYGDSPESRVEFAFAAQKEALLKDESPKAR
jgi:HicB family